MAGAENQNEEPVVFDLADEAVISHSVFPELSEFGTLQGLTNTAWVIQWGDAFVKELQDAFTLLRVELSQFAVNLGREFNLPSHAASERLPMVWCAHPRCGYGPMYARPDTDPQGHPGVRGWLGERRKSWCGRCGGGGFFWRFSF